MDAMDSQVHDERGAMQTDASDSPEAGTHAVAAPSVNNKVGGGLRSFCKVPEKKKPAASKQRDGASASGSAQGVSDKGVKLFCSSKLAVVLVLSCKQFVVVEEGHILHVIHASGFLLPEQGVLERKCVCKR